MAMYYYASKLNEASCSGCQLKTQPAPAKAPSMPPGTLDSSVTTGTTLIHGSALSYYDNDDYYSMVRTPKISTEKLCKHSTMNGGMIPVQLASSGKSDERQMSHMIPITVKSASPSPIPIQSIDTVDAILPEVEYRDGQLVCATLEALVDMLRLNTSKSFAFTFILCSRLYIKPHELLAKLSKRHFKNCEKQKLSAETELAEMAALVRVLGEWTRNFPYDFRDDRMMALVRSITQRCATEHMVAIRDEVSAMLQKLLERLTALEQYEETLCESPQVASVELLPLGDVLTLGLSPVELATQLTIVELHRLSFIGPEEFVQAFTPVQTVCVGAAGGSSYSNASVGLLHSQGKSTRNLEAYADWFNRLSYLVATDILKAVKTKYRVRVLEQWVMCARECFNLGNFNSLMAIISALNMAPISRLKKTWSRASGVAEQQLRALEVCVAPGGNHARYRAARAAAGPSAVPLLSVTCRDLHFAHHAAPNRLSGNRINFEKCRDLARHVSNQLASRRLLIEDGASGESASSSQSPLENQKPHDASWRYLNDKPTLTEHGMELVSFEREPPSDHMEKERYKRLRIVP